MLPFASGKLVFGVWRSLRCLNTVSTCSDIAPFEGRSLHSIDLTFSAAVAVSGRSFLELVMNTSFSRLPTGASKTRNSRKAQMYDMTKANRKS